MSIFWWFLALITFPFYLIYKFEQRAEYFKKNGIPYVGGFFRNIRFILGKQTLLQVQREIYKIAVETKSPIVGITDLTFEASLYIADLDLVKAIEVTDFDHFGNNREIPTGKANKYFRKMLFLANNDEWKRLRTKLNPAFTSGKLKRMFQVFKTSSERMTAYLKEQMEYPKVKSMNINFCHILPKYAMDVIASCAFGIDSKSFEVKPDQRSTFEQMASQYGFRSNGKAIARQLLNLTAPKVADYFEISALDPESENYFANVIKEVIKRRRQTGERRDDFLQLLMETQEGILSADENAFPHNTLSNITNENEQTLTSFFDDDHIVGTCLSFLMGGTDPTESALLWALYALAMEPIVQEKLWVEVSTVMDGLGGHLSYEAIADMKYLDLVIKESLRFYPHSVMTGHVCRKNYSVPGTNQLIEKGTMVWIPIHEFHKDSRYFPQPERFIPERFTAENKASLHSLAFMAFGHGNRMCIGMRFALIKVKAAIAQLVYSFQFAPSCKSKIPLEFDRGVNVKPKGGEMWLRVTVREKNAD